MEKEIKEFIEEAQPGYKTVMVLVKMPKPPHDEYDQAIKKYRVNDTVEFVESRGHGVLGKCKKFDGGFTCTVDSKVAAAIKEYHYTRDIILNRKLQEAG